MKRFAFLTAICTVAAFIFIGCQSNSVRISGQFVGLNAKTLYLEQMSASGQAIIDSVSLAKDGTYNLSINNIANTPSLYNLVYNGDRIPLLVQRGEDIEVSALGNALINYTVSGSPESELLRQFNKEYLLGQIELSQILASYPEADKQSREHLAERYNRTYRDIKRKQISFIIENKESVASVYALYQRLQGEEYLASADSDLIYYRTVANALAKHHKNSPFLITLNNDIARMEARISLLSSIESRTFPELKGVDMYGNETSLSSLKGNIILVDFWSAEAGNSNAFNADLKEIYEEFNPHGFSIYQVSADTSKAIWITAVQEQQLPWVSVCDFKGEHSPMLRAYNIRKLPSNFLIDREGNIIAKDIYSDALADKLREIIDK